MSTDSKDKIETEEDGPQDINPFSLDYRGDAGFLDFSPKAVSADPKEDAVARLEEHTFGETGIPLQVEPEQDTLPLTEPDTIPIEVMKVNPEQTVEEMVQEIEGKTPVIPQKKPSISRNAH